MKKCVDTQQQTAMVQSDMKHEVLNTLVEQLAQTQVCSNGIMTGSLHLVQGPCLLLV